MIVVERDPLLAVEDVILFAGRVIREVVDSLVEQ